MDNGLRSIVEMETLLDKIYAEVECDLAAKTLKNVVLINDKKKLLAHMQRLYAIAFENGIKFEKSKHANNLDVKVNQIDSTGKVIKTWDSMAEARKELCISSKNSIPHAIKTKQKCYGYYWEKAV